MSIAAALTLRQATAEDAPQLWEWRNDPLTRANSINSVEIPREEHSEWLRRKLNSPECRIWILEREGTAVGQIRYDRYDATAQISILIAAGFRGQGLGTRLLELSARLACRQLHVRKLVGIVKQGNESSRRAFERAGFSLGETVEIAGQRCHRFERMCTLASA